jgi:putative DNA primase/helicase
MLRYSGNIAHFAEAREGFTSLRRLNNYRGTKMSIYTDYKEFMRFHSLLMATAPEGYQPFYFPLDKEGKDPLPKISWKNNRKTFKEACSLMRQGYNIGIAATDKDPLVIVDIDDKSQVPELKPTLKIISRKRLGEHNFFFTNDKPGAGRTG